MMPKTLSRVTRALSGGRGHPGSCCIIVIDSQRMPSEPSEVQVAGVVLGGTALFRTDGQTQYGARKLISGLLGVVYESGEEEAPA